MVPIPLPTLFFTPYPKHNLTFQGKMVQKEALLKIVVYFFFVKCFNKIKKFPNTFFTCIYIVLVIGIPFSQQLGDTHLEWTELDLTLYTHSYNM